MNRFLVRFVRIVAVAAVLPQPQVSIALQKGARILLAGHPPLDYD